MNLDALTKGGLSSSNWTAGNIVAALIFSSIGMVMFMYGKREQDYKMMGWGAVLMTYCYFTPTAMITTVCGLGILAAGYYLRD